jgi:hypothetical protein
MGGGQNLGMRGRVAVKDGEKASLSWECATWPAPRLNNGNITLRQMAVSPSSTPTCGDRSLTLFSPQAISNM